MTPSGQSLEIGAILMGLAGGLAIFLYGMELLTNALKASTGKRLKNLLARMTTNRFKGVVAGALVTAIIQSSSVTTVLVVGFVSAGLMHLQQSIPIIMGASIGTTITAQIIAFKITHFALLIVALGFAMQFLSRNEVIQRTGTMIFGFGLIFFGMSLMGDATSPLRDYPPFIKFLQEMKHPLYGILASAAFTAVVQSSSATTGVIIVLATQGLISLDQGIALVFGANIGTCVTALLASIGKSREALRTALVHILFNTLGVIVWFWFIPEFATFIRDISPQHPELQGIKRLAAETPRQIANAHTMFNVGNTILFIGFTAWFARLVTWLVPVTEEEKAHKVMPKYLDKTLLDTPSLALDRVRMEIGRMAEHLLPMLRKGVQLAMDGNARELSELNHMDSEVGMLHGPILDYLQELSKGNLSSREAELAHHYLAIASYYENIGDSLKLHLIHVGRKRLAEGLVVGEETRKLIEEMVDTLIQLLEKATQAVTRMNRKPARKVVKAKTEINRLAADIERHVVRRMTADAPRRRLTYQTETELLEALKRVYYFTKRIAKEVLNMDTIKKKEKQETP
ncbi:Na/Pi cotransporter family protein [Thiolapillus brandeum]|uniref:Na+/phosphate symporter n=1 Tax=Thiolapillus brandeum TaxID=1076588 RepID=A0A7U6JHX4_9GAMM|nr:Na/Pi cotransporter family protein [Thiolapillus brandeum]BAO44766.1 Na+/phosphate symporter [Thiolapillus brandeum]